MTAIRRLSTRELAHRLFERCEDLLLTALEHTGWSQANLAEEGNRDEGAFREASAHIDQISGHYGNSWRAHQEVRDAYFGRA